MNGELMTLNSNPASIEDECLVSDLVVGTVLIPGAKVPKLISRDLIKRMQPGSAIVDISVDQGDARKLQCRRHTKIRFL
jgi:alanine dehydrogenase